jgi:hypothetical protein
MLLPHDAPRGGCLVHMYVRSKVGWVTLPEGTPAFDVYYDHGELWPSESLGRLEAVLPRT